MTIYINIFTPYTWSVTLAVPIKLSVSQYHLHVAPVYNKHLMDMINELNGHTPNYTKHITNNDRHYRYCDTNTLAFTAIATKHYTKNNIIHIIRQHTLTYLKTTQEHKDKLVVVLA